MFRVASRIKKPSRLLTLKKSQTVSSLKTENNSWKIEEPEINDSMKIKEEPEIKDLTEIKEEQLLTLSGRDAHFSPEQMIAESEEVDELYRGIDILLLAHAPAILDAYAEFIRMAAAELDVDFGGFSDPLIHQNKWRVNKSTFKYGKHKIEYMSRSYKKVVHLNYLTGSTRDILLTYIQSNVPAGVGIEVRSFKLVQFPDSLKSAIEKSENYLSEHDSDAMAKNLSYKEKDTFESRKYKTEMYEYMRRPWNPSIHDMRREDVHKRRRTWRRETTLNNL